MSIYCLTAKWHFGIRDTFCRRVFLQQKYQYFYIRQDVKINLGDIGSHFLVECFLKYFYFNKLKIEGRVADLFLTSVVSHKRRFQRQFIAQIIIKKMCMYVYYMCSKHNKCNLITINYTYVVSKTTIDDSSDICKKQLQLNE